MMKNTPYVAILGFANQIDENQISLTEETASKLVALGYGVAVGNLTGTFYHALRTAKKCGGATLGIIEKELCELESQDCDVLQVVSSQEIKHREIASRCIAGIVIGGGFGTLKLIQRFLDRNKKMVAIEGSGGVVTSELDPSVILSHSVDHALTFLEHLDE